MHVHHTYNLGPSHCKLYHDGVRTASLTFFPKLVIYASLFRVGQNLVGLCDLFEPVLCVGIAVLVWVELEGQLPVGFLDVVLVGFRGDTQDFVEVLACGLDGQTGQVLLRLAAFLRKQEQSGIRLTYCLI